MSSGNESLPVLLDSITPEIYASLKLAIEIGKWPNGERISDEQRALCMQAVIYYDGKHKPEQERVGYIERTPHEHCSTDDPAPDILQWKDTH